MSRLLYRILPAGLLRYDEALSRLQAATEAPIELGNQRDIVPCIHSCLPEAPCENPQGVSSCNGNNPRWDRLCDSLSL